ncbi:MAG: hypothetical protein AB1488_01505 [Nitrospirota bacterium]
MEDSSNSPQPVKDYGSDNEKGTDAASLRVRLKGWGTFDTFMKKGSVSSEIEKEFLDKLSVPKISPMISQKDANSNRYRKKKRKGRFLEVLGGMELIIWS